MSEARGPWVRHAREVVHTNPWYRVVRDEVTRPDGTPGEYYTVVNEPAVFVVALDDRDRVALVRLYRYTVGRWSLEVPAGRTDGEDPLTAARRELAEEAGLAAGSWEHLGLLHPANGLLAEDNHVFLARDLAGAGVDRAELVAEGISSIELVARPRAWDLVRDGSITDGQTVAALALADLALADLALADLALGGPSGGGQ
ncbi:MAG: NUDIX domain-containing protein [Acidimicrobiales bacterium]